jgi:hypothetical protein
MINAANGRRLLFLSKAAAGTVVVEASTAVWEASFLVGGARRQRLMLRVWLAVALFGLVLKYWVLREQPRLLCNKTKLLQLCRMPLDARLSEYWSVEVVRFMSQI